MADLENADRKKLIELLTKSDILCNGCGENSTSYCIEGIANLLIANGVTFATDNHVGGKWVPANGWSQRKNCASCAHASDTHFAEACGKCGELLDTDTGIPEEKCIGCMLNWLRQPAEGGCDG